MNASDSKGWLSDLLSGLPVVAWSTDAKLRVQRIHDESMRSSSKWRTPAAGTPLIDWLGVADAKAEVYQAHRLATNGTTTSFRCECGGENLQGWVRPVCNRSGKVTGCLAIAVSCGAAEDDSSEDSDRTTYSGGLVQSSVPWEQIIEAAVDFVLILDEQGVVKEVSRADRIVTRERVQNERLFDHIGETDREELEDALRRVVRTGISERCEFEIADLADRPKYYTGRIMKLRETEDRCSVIMSGTDITRRKENEKKLTAEEATLRQLLEVNDRERRLIAYEIHDGLVQDVVGAQMILSAAADDLISDPIAASQLRRVNELLGVAINEGRRLISDLRPMVIDEMGVVEAIRYLVDEEQARGQMTIALESRTSFVRLEPLLEGTLFRIAQEALNNARRHGESQHVEIRLTQIGDAWLILEIQDDGVGFDFDSIPEHRYGIEGMRERALAFGGGLTIESRSGQGTRITVKFPLALPESKSQRLNQPPI